MVRGESLTQCLADYPLLSDELRPLLQLAEIMADAHVAPPPAPHGLDTGRARLLAAAQDAPMRDADASVVTATGATVVVAPTVDDAAACDAAACDAALCDALDAALATGGPPAEEVAPLVAFAAMIGAHVIAPPVAPTRLERGRDRFLVAAADARDALAAVAAHADGDASLTEALDDCVARTAQGVAVTDATAAHPHQASALTPLVALAQALRASVLPAPARDLARGRARLLTAAAALRAEGRAGLLASFVGSLGLRRPRSVARVAAGALAALVVLSAGAGTLAPAAAAALPGDRLYVVKRAGEEVRLALAFDPALHGRLEAEFSRERAREITSLTGEGRDAQIDRWDVRYLDFADESRPDQARHGTVRVATLGPEPAVLTLVWDQDTRFDIPEPYQGWSGVPPGTRLVVRVQVEPGKALLALAIQVADPAAPAETTTPTATTTPEETSLPASSETPEATPTAPTETAVPTPSSSPTPVTPTVTPELTSTQDPGAAGRKPSRSTLRGIVEEKVDDATWRIAEQAGEQGTAGDRRIVVADLANVAPDQRKSVSAGDWVQLHGTWRDGEHKSFVALSIDRVRTLSRPSVETERCTVNTVVGRVASVDRAVLALTDGATYDVSALDAASVPAGVAPGARVEVVYKDCGDGKRVATLIRLLEAQTVRLYQGTVETAGDGRFTLVTHRGTRYTVVYDQTATIVGAGSIAVGQTVQVRGWEDEGTVHALEIRIRSDETETSTPAPPETPAPPPTVGETATASATLTVEVAAVPAMPVVTPPAGVIAVGR
jgi:hypothetical protein